MLGSSSTASVPSLPPFYWKVPAPEKNYMGENIRRIRQLNSQNKQKSKTEGLKATFIPGVTKNPKYEHVPSRLSGLLKGEVQIAPRIAVPLTRSRSQTSGVDKLSNNRPEKFSPSPTGNLRISENQSNSLEKEVLKLKPIWGASAAANARRLSRSTTDLSAKRNLPEPVRSLRRKPVKPPSIPVQQESIYNWQFPNTQDRRQQSYKDDQPSQYQFPNTHDMHHMHHVEYLPCDGICAEETVVDDGRGDSARSGASSSRTSRGVNTEETRIFLDQSVRKQFMHPVVRRENIQDLGRHNNSSSYTQNATSGPVESNWNLMNGQQNPAYNSVERNFAALKLSDSQKDNTMKVHSCSSQSAQTEKPLPHPVGAIPKYLQQRKQEWKEEAEAKKEAERNADVPVGHVLLSDSERLETLRTLKANYDSLITELNRIPIRIDTIRVRDQKAHLEEQLAKLEQAMRVFSRPRVYVKMDQP